MSYKYSLIRDTEIEQTLAKKQTMQKIDISHTINYKTWLLSLPKEFYYSGIMQL